MTTPAWAWTVANNIPGSQSVTAIPSTLEAQLPTDLMLDTVSGDLATPIQLVRGVDCVLQLSDIYLSTWLGEWFLDKRLGVPYRERIFVKNPSLPTVNRIYTNILTSIPGVSSVASMNLAFDRSRLLSITNLVFYLLGSTRVTASRNSPLQVVQ